MIGPSQGSSISARYAFHIQHTCINELHNWGDCGLILNSTTGGLDLCISESVWPLSIHSKVSLISVVPVFNRKEKCCTGSKYRDCLAQPRSEQNAPASTCEAAQRTSWSGLCFFRTYSSGLSAQYFDFSDHLSQFPNMTRTEDQGDGRVKLVPQSPRIRARSSSPAGKSTSGSKAKPFPESADLQAAPDHSNGRQEEDNHSMDSVDQQSSGPVLPSSAVPSNTVADNVGISSLTSEEVQEATTPISPRDVPLPSIESDELDREISVDSCQSLGGVSLTPSISVDFVAEDSSELAHHGTETIANDLRNLRLDSASLEPTFETDGTPQTPPSDEIRHPTTVRDLVNATPMPSPEPTSSPDDGRKITEPLTSSLFPLANGASQARPQEGRRIGPSTSTGSANLDPDLPSRPPTETSSTPSSENEVSDPDIEPPAHGVESEELAEELNELQLDEGEDTEHASQSAETDETDLSDEMDDNDPHEAYDVRKEPLPISPFSDQRFQESLKKGADLTKEITACLAGCPLATDVGTELHRLRQSSERLSNFDCPAERRIAIIGDSGAGIFPALTN